MKNFFLFVVMILFVSSNANAAKIDFWRNILESRNYTIQYENLTPAERVTNKNTVPLYGKTGLAVEGNDFFLHRPLNGIITSNGDNRYEEVGYEDFFQCRLVSEGENFIFTRYKNKKGETEYFGIKKGEVEANSRNYLAELLEGESFGDANFTKMMSAIISDNNKSAEKANYKFVASGTLDNGLYFEDFSAKNDSEISAIRYYFEDDVLTKIAFASYGRDESGNAYGNKCIVKILKFTDIPDENLLKLPNGLKNTTKH